MDIQEFVIPGVKLLTINRHTDNRGWLNENWRDEWASKLEMPDKFVQDMMSWNDRPYTLRGLHRLSVDQYKLVSVLNGQIFDVVVDGRPNSPTYRKHITLKLASYLPTMLLVPPGCYHGYLTIEPNTAVAYKVSHYHLPELDEGIAWNDPSLDIQWPLYYATPIVSDKDSNHPLL